jgi:hypothetical protein
MKRSQEKMSQTRKLAWFRVSVKILSIGIWFFYDRERYVTLPTRQPRPNAPWCRHKATPTARISQETKLANRRQASGGVLKISRTWTRAREVTRQSWQTEAERHNAHRSDADSNFQKKKKSVHEPREETPRDAVKVRLRAFY